MRVPRFSNESGSSLTEFAIIAPLLILLVFWSEFFTDLGIFKLKLDEAARYAVWEMTAQRPPAAVAAEIQAKFAKLYSPDDHVPSKPPGILSFPTVTVTTVTINDNLPAPFAGTVRNPWGGGGGGFVAQVMSFLYGLLNQAVDAVLRIYGFDTGGEAQATAVTFQAQDTLFPGTDIRWLAFHMNDNAPPLVTMTTQSSPLLVNTWKAWPGKYSLYNQGNVETDPYSTYGQPSAPEQEVSARMGKMAFFGINRVPIVGTILRVLNRLFNMVGMPGITQTSTWADSSGPVSMFPGDRAKHTWAPGNGMPVQRGGDAYDRRDQNLFKNFDSPSPGIDRSRSTTPGAIHTDWWGGDGGPTLMTQNSSRWGGRSLTNPYVKAYKCRDAWYMGAASGQVPQWGKTFSQWARAMTPGCP